MKSILSRASRRAPSLGTVAGLALWWGLAAGGASAQGLDVPVVVMEGDGQAAVCATSTVSGLDPNGDNFLAVRSGPGTQHRQVDQLHTGDVVFVCDGQGSWFGIYYPDLSGRSGWVHGSYLTPLAG